VAVRINFVEIGFALVDLHRRRAPSLATIQDEENKTDQSKHIYPL